MADLPLPDKRRPVVLVSREESYGVRQWVTVAPVTTRLRPIASHVAVGRGEGLKTESAINCDQLMRLHRSILKSRVGPLGSSKLEELNEALRFSLGLD